MKTKNGEVDAWRDKDRRFGKTLLQHGLAFRTVVQSLLVAMKALKEVVIGRRDQGVTVH